MISTLYTFVKRSSQLQEGLSFIDLNFNCLISNKTSGSYKKASFRLTDEVIQSHYLLIIVEF